MRAVVLVVAAYLLGTIPFSNLFARALRGVDLRDAQSGTVSGTALYRVAGFVPLAIAGSLDVAKGAAAALAAGARPGGPASAGVRYMNGSSLLLVAACAVACVAGHNWSVFLRGAGGRGISPALGVLCVSAWPGAVLLLAGLAVGRAYANTGLGGFVSFVLLVPCLFAVDRRDGATIGASVLVPMLAKRVTGNRRPIGGRRALLRRLLLDRE